jgi:hypothetical protein
MPAAISIDAAGDDVAIGLTDSGGRLFGGTVTQGIRQLSPENVRGLVSPHVGAIAESTTISAFTTAGLIFHAALSGHSH